MLKCEPLQTITKIVITIAYGESDTYFILNQDKEGVSNCRTNKCGNPNVTGKYDHTKCQA